MQVEKSNNLPSIYSQVIFKNQNDREAEDMVNSYKYKSSSPGRFQKWTPEFSYEERYKKKRNREDQYISQIENNDRPILVIKKKHEYKGLKNPKVFNDDQLESYYKVSENTQLVDDLEDEIRHMETFIRRHTFVHRPKNSLNDEEGLATVYKIEGQEFLPEGFIELDPLLMKDEYEFESKQDEKKFDKEQRQMKGLRRKQYGQRHNNKLRDVTIYVMDEKKNSVVEFLEKWYEKHKRKINQAEIEYVAKVLDVDPKQLEYFQDLYIKIKHIQYSKELGDKSKSPGKNGYDQVEPKYMQYESPYVPTFLNKYEKKSQKLPRYNIKKKSSKSPVLNTKELDKTLIKTLGQTNEITDDQKDIEFSEQHESRPNLKLQESQKKFEANLEQYFDTEIHSILDKIKGAKDNRKQGESSEVNQEYVELYKKKMSENDNNLQKMNSMNKDQSFDIPKTNQVRISQQNPQQQSHSMLSSKTTKLPKRFTIMGMGQEKMLTTQKLKPIFIGNEYFYQTVEVEENPKTKEKKEILFTRNDQGHLLSEYVIPKEKQGDFYENYIQEKPESFIGDNGKEVIVKNDKDVEVFTQVLRPTKSQIFKEDLQEELDKPNFRMSKIDISDNIKTHHLPPLDFQGNEYKVVVEEMNFPEQNFEQINVLVYDAQNNIVSNKSVDPHLKGSFYNSAIEEVDDKFYLVTKNNHGEHLDDMELGNIQNQEVNNQVTVDEEEDIKVIKLNPIAIGDRFIRQEIKLSPDEACIDTYNDLEEKMESKDINKDLVTDQCKSVFDHDKEQIIIKTLNENNEVLHEYQVPLEYAHYQNQNFDDFLIVDDEKGKPRASIAVKQRNAKIFRSYSLRPTLIGDKFYNQTINEVLDEDDPQENKAVLITQDEEGNTIDVKEIDPQQISDNYYNQITNQMIDNFGNKTSDLVTFNDDKQIIAKTKVSTTLQSKLTDNFYDNIIEEIVNENDEGGDEEITEILALKKIEDGTYEIYQEEVKIDPKKKREYYENIFHQIPEQERRRSYQQKQREKSNTVHGMPENYKFLQSEVAGDEQNSEEEGIIDSKQSQDYYDNKFKQIPEQNGRRSYQQKQRDQSNTVHGMPENYKFLQSEVIGNDQNIDEQVRDYINNALEEADLIRKMDEKQVQEIKDSMKNVPGKNSEHDEQNVLNKSRKSTVKEDKTKQQKEVLPEKKKTKKLTKNFDKEKVEEFIQKNSTKEDAFKKKNQADQKKEILKKKKKGTNKIYTEKPKFKTYTQIHKEKLSPSPQKNVSLIQEIYGDLDDKENKEKDQFENEINEQNEVRENQDQDSQDDNVDQDHQNEDSDQNKEDIYWDSNKEIEVQQQGPENVESEKKENIKNKEQESRKQSSQQQDSQFQSFEQLPEKDQSDNTSFKSFERHESDLKNHLKEVLDEENKKMGPEFMKKLQKKTGFKSQDELLDDFYRFCLSLQNNTKYKESVLFATLFFYYLERKKKLKERIR